jgi:uncharacterized protein involved in outer membrane biogenesis
MRKLLIGIVVLVLILVIAVVVIASQAGNLIERGVETYGPEITGTSVTLSDVDISLLSGHASINNLMVGNPKGFKTDHAFKVAEVSIELDLSSLTSEQIRIKKILIDGAELSYEQINKRSNIDALRRNVEKNIGAGDNASAGSDSDSSGGSDVQLLIDDLYINGTQVTVRADVFGQQEEKSVTIADIHLRNLGKNGSDSSIAGVVDEVVRLVTKAVTQAAIKELGERKAKEAINKKKHEVLKNLDDKLADKLKGLF